MTEPHVGDVLGGVRIDAVLGRGGMGLVYRGTELALKRTVAIKLIREDFAGDPEFRARFTRESELAASLEHSHVIPIFSAGEDRGQLYVTMRYIDGTDLREAIKRHGRLDPLFAATVVAQIASALDAAHRRGLVHRDIKPANVLLADFDGQPHAYLTDFGVCRAMNADGMTKAGMVIGTHDYMAPEQFEDAHVDGRADIYSLGCVLYQALAGQVPFPRDTMAAKIYAHMSQAPAQLLSDVPPQLNRVIGCAMAKRPADRYATAGEMGRDVLHAVEARSHTVPLAPSAVQPVPQTGVTVPRGPASHPSGPTSHPSGPTSHPSGPTSYPPGSSGPPSHPSHPSGPTSYPPGPMTYPTGAPIYPTAGLVYPTAGLAQVTSPRRGRQTALVLAIVAALVVVLGSVGGWLIFRGKVSDPPPPPPPEPFGAVDGDPINVGKEPIDIVGGGGFMWTANNGDATISKIDPASGTATQIEVGGDPLQLATTPGKVWVWNYTDAVTRVDVDTEEVSEPIATSPDIAGIAAADGVVWLSHSTDNTVTRLDGNTGALIGQPIKVGAKPGQLAAGDQSVLVINEGDKNISVVNSDGTVQTTLTVDDDAGGIEFVDDTFYLLSSSNLTPVDERTLTVGVPVSLQGAYSATAGNDGIFAAYPVTDELRWFDLTGNETKGTPLTAVAEEVSELIYIDGTLWLVDGPDGEAVRVKVR